MGSQRVGYNQATELNQSEVLNTLKKPNASYNSSKTANTESALATRQETRVWSLGHEDPFEKGIAAHSSTLAWRIPWTEEPGGLQSMGHRENVHVGHLARNWGW